MRRNAQHSTRALQAGTSQLMTTSWVAESVDLPCHDRSRQTERCRWTWNEFIKQQPHLTKDAREVRGRHKTSAKADPWKGAISFAEVRAEQTWNIHEALCTDPRARTNSTDIDHDNDRQRSKKIFIGTYVGSSWTFIVFTWHRFNSKSYHGQMCRCSMHAIWDCAAD
jgi:hypothetical protein